MSRRPLVDALTDAIERIANEDPGLFSDVHAAEGALNVRLAARDLASALNRDIETAKLGRGRVTDRRLDQRLRR